jgi:hypothetical protein
MKIRNGFVSNSSSSSFVIAKSALSYLEIYAIKNHSTLAEDMNIGNIDEYWSITEDEHTIEGWTSMDNFDMDEYLTKIGIDSQHVKWGE